MRLYPFLFLFTIIVTNSSHGQILVLKKSKQPIFLHNSEWVMDISEIKIYDDDLIFGRVKFTENKSALDSLERKINQHQSIHEALARVSAGSLTNITVSEAGSGLVDFYSTKFKKKYSRDFYYVVSTADNMSYLTFIIDIEKSGTFYPLSFSIDKIQKNKSVFEVQLLDTKKQLSDFRLVRVQQ